MTTITPQQQDLLVQRHVELEEIRDTAIAELQQIKGMLADTLGIGKHPVAGLTVAVKPPNRKFNLDRAVNLLTDEQRTLSLTPDAATVKGFLSPVLLDTVMDPGTGAPTVTVTA